MKKSELFKYLKGRYKSENFGGGEWVFYLKSDEEGTLEIMPNLRKVVDGQYVNTSLAMRPKWFIDLSEIIFGKKSGSYFFTKSNIEVHSAGCIDIPHVEELLELSMAWFYSCMEERVIASELKAKYEIYDRPGGWQFTHIIACVLNGDVKKLRSYLESFEREDRMGFIPIIKQEYFERAIPLAEKYSSGELKPPVSF